jgi:hypothetical protein
VRTRLSKICQETTSLPKRSNDQKPKAKSTTPTLSQTAEIKSPSQKDRKRYRSLHICKKLKRAAVKYTLVESDPLFTLSFFFCQAEGIRDGCKGRDKKKGQNEQRNEEDKRQISPPNPGLNHGILVYKLVMVMMDSWLRSLDRYRWWWWWWWWW